LRVPTYLPVELTVVGHTLILEALIDTGFDGGVAVAPETITNGQPARWRLRFTLADGSRVHVPAYRGTIRLGDFAPLPTVVIALGDQAILGRSVTDHFRLILDHGQRVIVEP
jgi:predicted aspartyl protease